jgi:hypothetical protein
MPYIKIFLFYINKIQKLNTDLRRKPKIVQRIFSVAFVSKK